MEADRYIRHHQLREFGPESQEKLNRASVLVVGLGGLGIPVVQYLTAMGVGNIGLVEQDIVELHNLQRQVLYSEHDVGKAKGQVALEKLIVQNSEIQFNLFDTFLTRDNALEIIKDFDIIVDATDNFETRYLINDACVILNKPFVYGALHGFEGQVSVFNHHDGPTYRCLFPEMPKPEEVPNCDENGVLGVLPGIIGTFQALETVKVITGVGEPLTGKLLIYDGLIQSIQKITIHLNPENKRVAKLREFYGSTCQNTSTISAEDFMYLQEKEEVQLVDVRNQGEFENFHLSSALNIPLSNLKTSLNKIDFEKPVYLICQSGKRSRIAFEMLQKENPKAILFNINGGMNKTTLSCP